MSPQSLALAFCTVIASSAVGAETIDQAQVQATMRRASEVFRTKAASHGGYVYYYSPDFTRRWGEGVATHEQIWVQRPGTPAVGLAFLRAYRATGDTLYLDAARDAAHALVYGQLASGGWTNAIDFDPHGSRVAQYRNGKGRGRNYSSLDDGISQHALRLLMHVDRALEFKETVIHEASAFARDALLAAQFSGGGFPQAWSKPVAPHPPVHATIPDYDWRSENRIKEYWDLPTLNDDLVGHVAEALADAWEIYRDERCREALLKLGDFLILAQLPEPQPGWAQQYDFQMRPAWARKFEPPAIASRESQNAVDTLLRIHQSSGEKKYLEPIPRALAYLRRSRLPDGRLARFYELGTNKPLYMTKAYELTHDDSDLPEHYGWKVKSRIDDLESAWHSGARVRKPPSAKRVREIFSALDAEGRWISTRTGTSSVGRPGFKAGEQFVASEVFIKNLELLSEYLAAHR